jgi:hypothetical protein
MKIIQGKFSLDFCKLGYFIVLEKFALFDKMNYFIKRQEAELQYLSD